jgi:DNA polymerase-2
MIAKGWLFDLYVREDVMILWFRLTGGEMLCLTDYFGYRFYAQGTRSALSALEKALGRYLRRTGWTERTEFWSGRAVPVLELEVRALHKLPEIQRRLADWAGGITFYNCDLAVPQYYAYERGLFSLAFCEFEWERNQLRGLKVLHSPWDPDAPIPSLKVIEVALAKHPQIPLDRGNSLQVTYEDRVYALDGLTPAEFLTEFNRLIVRLDPDCLLSQEGDGRIFPCLWRWSEKEKIPLVLDRDPHPPPRRRVGEGRSYFTYGQIAYQGAAFPLFGRFHIDRNNSFFFTHGECGLEGTIFLARLTKIPVQTLARTSPGTAITSMQLDRAVQKGILIPWKKGRPEEFKTAWDLLVSDKGGLVFQPPIGLREEVAEVDFASMYPTIMVRHNISPETMLCSCCPEPVVPEAGTNICRRRRGLVPETLEPILKLRAELKSRIKAGHPRKAVYQALQKGLKWVLVTCFGYLGYKNARFGRIEAHEAITAFGRDKLLIAKECAEARGYQVLHGLTDSLWFQGERLVEEDIKALLEEIEKKTDVPISLEGIYRWIVFLPSKVQPRRPVANRYFGAFQDGTLKTRGIARCRSDMPRFVREAQEELLGWMARAGDRQALEKQVPEILTRLGEYAGLLKGGRVHPTELVITRRFSRPLDQYRVATQSALTLQQLEAEGLTLHPGQRVSFLLRDSGAALPEEKVVPAPFLTGGEPYDHQKYLELLLKAGEELLISFGWNYKALQTRFL